MDITTLIADLRVFLGVPPTGFEWLEYVIAAVFLLIIVQSCITFVSGLFRLFGGGYRA